MTSISGSGKGLRISEEILYECLANIVKRWMYTTLKTSKMLYLPEWHKGKTTPALKYHYKVEDRTLKSKQ